MSFGNLLSRDESRVRDTFVTCEASISGGCYDLIIYLLGQGVVILISRLSAAMMKLVSGKVASELRGKRREGSKRYASIVVSFGGVPQTIALEATKV